jgi:hypothetical protein
MSRHKMNKTTSQKIHSGKRFKERYGRPLTETIRKKIISTVGGSATLVQYQTNRISVYDAVIDKEVIRFVYDNIRKGIVTFLFPNEEPVFNEDNRNRCETKKDRRSKRLDMIFQKMADERKENDKT